MKADAMSAFDVANVDLQVGRTKIFYDGFRFRTSLLTIFRYAFNYEVATPLSVTNIVYDIMYLNWSVCDLNLFVDTF